MRTVYSTISFLAASLLFFSSCNDCSTNVAQFENGEGGWTVYGTGDTLRMADQTDTVHFVNTRTSSEPVPGEGFNVADVCIEQYDTRRTSVMQDAARKLPGLSIIAQKSTNDIRVSLVVVNRAEFQIPDINSPQHDTLSIRSVRYTNVFDLVDPDITANGVRRIQYNKEFGYLRVVYFNGRTLERIPNP